MNHITTAEFHEQLSTIKTSSKDRGVLKKIVLRPEPGKNRREVVRHCTLSKSRGAIGDRWETSSWYKLPDGSPDPAAQIAIIDSRILRIIAQTEDREALAGDNLCVDFDLGPENLQPGDRLQIGKAVLEITDLPHLPCKKFEERFGKDCFDLFNGEDGRRMRLRGIYAKTIKDGDIQIQDEILKISRE